MAEVRWTPQAADDPEAICLFIARDSPHVAAAFADRVLRAAGRLENFPRAGRMVPELEMDNIREIIVGSYRVIYQVKQQDDVRLLTVHHGARFLDKTKLVVGD